MLNAILNKNFLKNNNAKNENKKILTNINTNK